MHYPLSGAKARSVLRVALLGALFVIALACAVGVESGQLQAQENPTNLNNGTVPPLARFLYDASPRTVQPGGVVTFTVTVVNTDTQYVDVVLGLTSTLPSGIVVLPNTVQANLGQARVTASGQVTWTGAIERPGNILITFQARVNLNTCGEQVSRSVLYEIARLEGSPSPQQLTNEAQFVVDALCSVYLPRISLSLSPLPALSNWDFEGGASAGWAGFENNQPRTLIVSTDQRPLPMPQGGKWFGSLGGAANKISELRQKFTLPTDHGGINLRFLYRVESSDDCGMNNDNGYVLLNGFLIGSAFRLCSQNAVNGWQTASLPVPGTFWGREVTLTLRSVTNASKNSSWFVDNFEFCSSDPRASQPGDCKKQ